ncbi:MAG: hypothetical protein V1867_05230 [Candidatus Falkowbacteria bacterium]
MHPDKDELAELDEINRKYNDKEKPKIRQLAESERAAAPGKFRAVVIKGDEYFQIEEDALSADNAATILTLLWWFDEEQGEGEMAIYNDQGDRSDIFF